MSAQDQQVACKKEKKQGKRGFKRKTKRQIFIYYEFILDKIPREKNKNRKRAQFLWKKIDTPLLSATV